MAQLLLLLAMLATAWLFVIGPQRRRVRDHRRFVAALRVGDRVVMTAGMFGTIRALTDDTAELELADGVVVTVARLAIGRHQPGFERTDDARDPDERGDDVADPE